MGKIRKIASQKHEATLSPFISDHVKTVLEAPLYRLPQCLAAFPRPWPFPRGDLYHWIPVLNRFDDILQAFNSHYGLDAGPQTLPFSRQFILNGSISSSDATTNEVLDELDLPQDADRLLIESLLDHTVLLYENCANRSLYASSAHLNHLLNTTSLSLLNLVLRLAFRLAQRYTQERVRMGGGPYLAAVSNHILQQHYQLDLDKLETLAAPFVKSLHPSDAESATIKQTDTGTSVTPLFAPDLATLAQDTAQGPAKWAEYGQPWLNYHAESSASDSPPASPTPAHRSSSAASSRSAAPAQPAHDAATASKPGLRLLELSADDLSRDDLSAVIKAHLPSLPKSVHYEFLCRVRIAAALAQSATTRQEIVASRVMAISNLAAIYPETQLQSRVFQHEADEMRRAQLPHQLCDLLHPPGKSVSHISTSLQSTAMRALESFSNHRNKSSEVTNAIGYNVNHGVLTYLVRKAVSDLSEDPEAPDTPEQAEWFESLFILLHSLPKSIHRVGDAFSAAGILDSFVQALKLKTVKAEQNRHRFLTFLDVFVYNTRDAFNSLVNAGGLDAISQLLQHEVDTALTAAWEGKGLPADWKTPLTFSKISYVQQQTLRTLFKVLKNMIAINGGPFDRLLRNLIESSQLLSGLRKVIDYPSIYGSNVWCGAVEIFTNFIHNEPTSYAAIAEGGLTKAFLDTVTLPVDKSTGQHGLLPTAESLIMVPLAFGAICLNEAGMKQFTESKALDRFFQILLDLACSKSFASGLSDGEQLGSAFDELARHHPSLKSEIIQKLVDLAGNLRDFLHRQKQHGSLMLLDSQGHAIPEIPAATTGEDVDMDDAGGSKPQESTSQKTTASDSIHLLFGLLQGVFHNHALCTPFAELGGIQALVDVSATAILHPEQVLGTCHGAVTKTMQIFIHQKPHLTIPLVLARMRKSLANLSAFVAHDNRSPSFSAYVKTDDLKALLHHPPSSPGTQVLNDLLIVRSLTHILMRSFAEAPHRGAHPISSVNMTDIYVEVIASLGKLQSRCVCEYMLLQDMAPAEDSGSKASGSALDAAQDFRAASATKPESGPGASNPSEESADPTATPAGPSDEKPSTPGPKLSTARDNFKMICSIVSRIPTDVASLYSALGKSLLLRRLNPSDAYGKQSTYAVASSIANAVVATLDCQLPDSMGAKLVDYYHRSSITCTSIAMIERTREAGMQPLTLILWKFKQAGGYQSLSAIGSTLLAHAQLPGYSDSDESRARGPTWAVEGLRNLTMFLGRSTSNKEIAEAQQTQGLLSAFRSERDKDKPDCFVLGQFLVEVRAQVLQFILPIWNSDAIANMQPEFVKAVCSILQLILTADAEMGASTRQDQVPAHAQPVHKTWSLGPPESLENLSRTFPVDLAEEALYRCNNNRIPASEYCELRSRHGSVPRFPIPARDLPPESERRAATGTSTNDVQQTLPLHGEPQAAPSNDDAAARDMVNRIVEVSDLNSGQEYGAPQRSQEEATRPPTQDSKVQVKPVAETSVTTVEDLDELRSDIRATMVDRCLFVLNKFDKLSFNLADLIIAGTMKAQDPPAMRADISETLIQSLISYQGSGNAQEDSAKIASCAHMLGVVLQDRSWLDAAQDDLRDNFDLIAQYLADVPAAASEHISWLANVLLVLEKLLSEEAQPTQISWVPPNAENGEADNDMDKVVELRAPLVQMDDKRQLFSRLVTLMPRIGKDATLGVAVVRVLVCLTRTREFAQELAERKNIQRLFLMIKQLSTVADRKFQSTVLIVLRQMIEDETIVRQVMRSEIQALFEKHSVRGLDTTFYTRHLYHLVLRDPEAFVEITNEMVALSKFDRSQAPQQLVLKSSLAGPSANADPANNAEAPASDSPAEPDALEKTKESSETQKATEVKAPIFERSDGVTNFLLSELLAYKEVQDAAPKIEGQDENKPAEDVEMAGAEPAAPSAEPKADKADDQKHGFKADENPIFVYRCFLLQSLTELLQSYNCCKLNFINFSRKAEPQANTPSKPRSGILYYLLNALIPVPSLQHASDDKAKINVVVSHWATSVVVALCAKTSENREPKRRDGSTGPEEDVVLLHVRRFVLEHTLKAFKETNTTDSPEAGYARLLHLADLFNRMLAAKPNSMGSRFNRPPEDQDEDLVPSQKQIARIMFEKNYIPALTASLADVDTNLPGATRAVKHILRPLKLLTHTAIELSLSGEASSEPDQSADEDDVSSATSLSERAGGREETPDLFRNSTLGMFEPGREDTSDSGSSADEEEDELYGDEYADDMEFDEDMSAGHEDDAVSDEDEDMDGMGPVEGMDGDVPMNMEIELEEEDHDHVHDDDDSLTEDDEDDDERSEQSDDDDDDDDEDHGDEEVQIMEEISGDDENASLVEGDEAGEWQDEEEENVDYDDDGPDPIVVMGEGDPLAGAEDNSDYNADALDHGDPLGMIENSAALDAYNEEIGAQHDHDEEDEPSEDDDEDEGEDEEEMEDEEIVYGSLDDFEDESEMPPFSHGWPPGRRHGMNRHVHHLPFMHSDYRERLFMGGFSRNHRHPAQGRTPDDDANPLLNRHRRPIDPPPNPHRHPHRMATMEVPFTGPNLVARLERELVEGGMGLETALLNIVHGNNHPGLQFTMRPVPGLQDEMRYVVESHPHRHSTNGPARDEPGSAVSFDPASTETRWQEAARLLFGPHYVEKSQRVVNAILKLLVPPALERERQRKRREEEEEAKKREEQRAKEKAEREEREAREREEQEREAREASERASREADAARRAEADRSATQQAPSDQDDAAESGETSGEAMDVEDDSAAGRPTEQQAEPEAPRQRVVTRIRGQELDITDLGIDMAYLEALPDEMQEEVIMAQYAEQRSNAAATGEEPTAINREFLDALPPEIREELLQQEARDRRRREREEQRRRDQAAGNPAQPEDIDLAMIASLDPMLRQQVLADTDDEILNALPPEIAAEARALGARHARAPRLPTSYLGPEPPAYLFGGSGARGRNSGERADRESKPGGKAQRKPIVQMLDKSGVATLLRLMFIAVVGGSKSSLNTILANACGNRQTRGELVNGLLSILQDGCADPSAVERCFLQLTARAKQTSALKTPQSAKKQAPAPSFKPDASPQLVINQCLGALHFLAARIPTIPHFFLSEHELLGGFKTRPSKKGKAKETRATKYPVVALLGLLERDSVLDNSGNLEQLSGLLAMVTRPLGDSFKKSTDRAQPRTVDGNAGASARASRGQIPLRMEDHLRDPHTTIIPLSASERAQEELDARVAAESAAADTAESAETSKEDEAKKHRPFTPPEISPESLRPIVNILMARECHRQTFQNTITTMTNLSAISGAKDIFKQQLLQHARDLAGSIQTSLRDLIKQLETVDTDMQAQSLAMSDLDPNGSDQTKLSRIIMALDYLYDPDTKTQSGDAEKNVEVAIKNSDLLHELEDKHFVELWDLLSSALDATKRSESEYFFNVATILLPLIEALLVVCKRVPMKDRKASPSGSEMRSIFFAFTNRHKKILNDLVRQSPKLMSANFSVLVKNSGVLEFDNKRNYFNRRLHHRTSEMRQYPHPSLQLSVRRDQVFLDSYKGLHYKTPQEIKYGKLNIRFHNEEGVDAGGVTREWFQVLARQMFNPDYALFVPVASDRTTFHPNNMSSVNEEHHLKFFEFIGRVIGKALYENRVLDCHFSRAVYKKILGQAVTMKDMETVDLAYSKNMEWMLNNDITDVLTETFSYSQDKFGVEEIIDLIPNGRNIAVTEENKEEYVRRVIDFRLSGSVQEQLDNFLKGFYDIVSPELISIFDEGELELLISGMPDIDVDDWKANTDYHNYNASSPQIQWFWRAVRSFDKEERAKLLQFVTGTGKVPLNGFKELEGMNGFTRFTIHKDFSSKDRLPSSHTCFNQLDLPEYDNYESLRKSVYTAMTTGNEYFGYA